MKTVELGCGCEVTEQGRHRVSHCPAHPSFLTHGLFVCGECGFASLLFTSLECHVYRVHLGVEIARPVGVG